MDSNVLPPHVIAARLEARGYRHKDGRSWECDRCRRPVHASWNYGFAMWLPQSGFWVGKPNVVEKAFCSGECYEKFQVGAYRELTLG